MTKLLYSATMSLDGFIAGPGGDMQWLAKHLAEPNPEADALMEDIGALLVGANTNSGDDPNVLGDGVRMFEHAGGNEVSLRPLDTSGTHTLWFQILRD